jgi:preprotein translocase subunit Sss1
MPDASVPSGQRTVFRDGVVFDGSGAAPVPADVVVRGAVIESVRVGGGSEVLPNDSVVDCTFPSALGHIDPSFNPPLDVSFFHHMPTPEEHLEIAKRNALVLLKLPASIGPVGDALKLIAETLRPRPGLRDNSKRASPAPGPVSSGAACRASRPLGAPS